MSYFVETTRKSEKTFDENINYLKREWDGNTITKFLDRVDEVIREISENPLLFPVFENNVRKAIINKRIILYYEIVDGKTVRLLVFRNTYHNPKKLKF